MPLPDLILAMALLMAAPGPTNALLALAGAERGWRGALPLVAVALASWLAVVLPLTLAGQAIATVPTLRAALALASALWVLWLALRLWRAPAEGTRPAVTAGAVMLTTFLNPKALVIGLALLPGAGPAAVAGFAGIAAAVGLAWAGIGALTRSGGALPLWLRRGTALWLGVLALWIAARGTGLMA